MSENFYEDILKREYLWPEKGGSRKAPSTTFASISRSGALIIWSGYFRAAEVLVEQAESNGVRRFSDRGSSRDLNPIENAFAKLKAYLRKAAERTVNGLWEAIGHIIDTYTPAESRNYFAAAGYVAT